MVALVLNASVMPYPDSVVGVAVNDPNGKLIAVLAKVTTRPYASVVMIA